MKPILILVLPMVLIPFIKGNAQQALPLKRATANIANKQINFFHAQSGISVIGGGVYSTLTIVFAAPGGEGFTITLATANTFGEKEYKVRPVLNPGIDNAQMAYHAKDKQVFEAVGKTGTGWVKITRLTNNTVEGIFSGKFKQQGKLQNSIEIKSGHFHATLTKPGAE